MRVRPYAVSRPALAVLLTAVIAGVVAGCSGSPARSSSASTSSAPAPATGTPAPSATSTVTPLNCAETLFGQLTPEQRIGQLLMVGFDTNAPLTSLDDEIGTGHVGNVIYLGGWDGAEKVRRTSEHLQALVSQDATGGIGLMISADQEGGIVHQLRGSGFTQPPTALAQASMRPAALTTAATAWAKELRAVGVNVNLAPVTDTVPADIGKGNEPIGKWGRQYGADPAVVSRAAVAFLKGMRAGGVEGTVKHFPGLGRIQRNTDFNATGITDSVATTTDPHLAPFAAGIEAGAGLVMVSSARYPKLDAKNAAMFSPAIIDGLLRTRLGFDGVVITDDLNAAAAKVLPVAERAVKYVGAGGDILLTGSPEAAAPMAKALAAAATSPDFAEKLDASVLRVLTLKERMGLLPCSATP